MFEFAWYWALFLTPLPLVIRLLLPKAQKIEMAALKAPIWHLHQQNVQQQHQSNSQKQWLPWLIWVLLVLAAARPQWLGEPITLPSEGRDLMVAVDLSGSMGIEDMEINRRTVDRLTMTKAVVSDFIRRRSGDRIGLILFGDTAYLQTPLTLDTETVAQMLDEAVLRLVGERTAIGDAIGLAAKRFDEHENSNRVLILLSDGQQTSGNLEPAEAMQLAKEKNVVVYTIGVASDKIISRGLFGRQRASDDLDENLLTQIAEQTGGRYFRARDTSDLMQIYKILDELEPIEKGGQQMRPLTALYYWPLLVALLLSLLPALKAVWPSSAKSSANRQQPQQ